MDVFVCVHPEDDYLLRRLLKTRLYRAHDGLSSVLSGGGIR
ncbi:hypothetical protein OTB20_41050 [Streptomyces sp. H27-H1]|nr:hypothetical protein [Streptomyces sp. H27-H1]MCY0932426.1 hypothetical protein [Streptomyces sp. H27-H1]